MNRAQFAVSRDPGALFLRQSLLNLHCMSAVLACHFTDASLDRLLYRDNNVSIWHDEQSDCLTLKWKGQQDLTSIKRGGERLLALMRELDVHLVLNDDSETVGTWVSALPWLVFNLLPEIRKFGLQGAAHVYARNRLARLSADAAKLLIDLDEANIRLFNSVDMAKTWLREKARISSAAFDC